MKSNRRPTVMPNGKFTFREEANAITCIAFRNGFLEDLHAGKSSPILGQKEFSHITDEEMKKLMVEASAKVEQLLRLKKEEPEEYWRQIEFFVRTYTKYWVKE